MAKAKVTQTTEHIDPLIVIFAPPSKDARFWNARQKLDPYEMQQLRESIRDDGLMQTPVVRLIGDQYQVVCGERRMRCIRKLIEDNEECYDAVAGRVKPATELFKTLKIDVLHNCDDRHASRLSITENLERKDLSEWELMEYCRHLQEQEYSRSDICYIIRRSQGWVSQTLSLYALPKEIQSMLSDGRMPRTVALDLLKVKSDKVNDVFVQAMRLLDQDHRENRERHAAAVEKCQSAVDAAAGNIVGAEFVGDPQMAKEAKTAKGMADRLLSDAIEKQRTAENRRSRLTSDVISRATDQVAGARKGKSTGMSQKAVRATINDWKKSIEELPPNATTIDVDGREVSIRDVNLVILGMQMTIGMKTERDVQQAVIQFCDEEEPPETLKIADQTNPTAANAA